MPRSNRSNEQLSAAKADWRRFEELLDADRKAPKQDANALRALKSRDAVMKLLSMLLNVAKVFIEAGLVPLDSVAIPGADGPSVPLPARHCLVQQLDVLLQLAAARGSHGPSALPAEAQSALDGARASVLRGPLLGVPEEDEVDSLVYLVGGMLTSLTSELRRALQWHLRVTTRAVSDALREEMCTMRDARLGCSSGGGSSSSSSSSSSGSPSSSGSSPSSSGSSSSAVDSGSPSSSSSSSAVDSSSSAVDSSSSAVDSSSSSSSGSSSAVDGSVEELPQGTSRGSSSAAGRTVAEPLAKAQALETPDGGGAGAGEGAGAGANAVEGAPDTGRGGERKRARASS